jgi:hypothetical protein
MAAAAIVLVGVAPGCGGGGGNGGGGGSRHSPFDGSYFAGFNRASNSSILIFVQRDNTANVTIAGATGID